MGNKVDYEAKLEAILAIPDQEVKVPNMPVDVALQENENLYKWSLRDAVLLATAGITQETLKEFQVRINACREAESNWIEDFRSQKEAQEQWRELSPLAYKMRSELIHTMRFAYRTNASLLSKLNLIAQGNSHPDMIQDLNDLSVLGKANREALAAVNFELLKLDSAADMANSMASLLAEANGDKAEQNESKIIRDKAFMYLKELADEIRVAGKFVFWKNKSRVKGYSSNFWKRKNKRKSKDTTSLVD